MVNFNSSIPVSSYLKPVVNAYASDPQAVKNLVKYVQGQPISSSDEDTFSSNLKGGIGSMAVFEGGKGLVTLNRIRKLAKLNGTGIKDAFKIYNEKLIALSGTKTSADGINAARKAIFNPNAEGSIAKKFGTYWEKLQSFKAGSKAVSAELKTTLKAEKAAAKAAKKGVSVTSTVAKKGTEAAAKKGILSKVGTFIKGTAEKPTLIGKALNKVGGSKVGKLLKGSGAGFMAAIDGAIEVFTQVIPTFQQLGFKKGMKQLGKSALKVAGTTLGWVGGEAAGTAIGAAIGTALFPGVGTAIGAAVGFLGGMLGAWLGGKAATAITGKPELEIAQEENAALQSQQIAQDPTQLNQLKQAVYTQAQDEAAQGIQNPETQKALEEIAKLEASSPTTATANPFYPSYQTSTTA